MIIQKTYTRKKYVDPFYYSKEWKAMRSFIKHINNNKCSKCGYSEARGMQVDHIIARKQRPDLAMDIRNLRLLCRKCHSSAGTSFGRGGDGTINKKYNASIGENGYAPGSEWDD